ncbi:MAG: hypothetical protein ACLTDR_03425 [Adlercreutzia equolifaciens]
MSQRNPMNERYQTRRPHRRSDAQERRPRMTEAEAAAGAHPAHREVVAKKTPEQRKAEGEGRSRQGRCCQADARWSSKYYKPAHRRAYKRLRAIWRCCSISAVVIGCGTLSFGLWPPVAAAGGGHV